MFSKNTSDTGVTAEQHMQLEYAQKRIRQKRLLYTHTVVFLISSVFMFLTNKILKYGVEQDWYLWVITAWGFLLALHIFNVFVTKKFMGADWERKQREILVAKQRAKIAAIQKEIETEFPLGKINKKKEPWEPSQ
ncbi:MAG: 2TM domain-containing protein [Flavobacteriaceae bacterium]